MEIRELYNKHKQFTQRRDSLECKQFGIESHLQDNPTDYTSVIANELVKSDIYRVEYMIKENKKLMEIMSHE